MDQRAKLLGLYPKEGSALIALNGGAVNGADGGAPLPVQITFVVPTGRREASEDAARARARALSMAKGLTGTGAAAKGRSGSGGLWGGRNELPWGLEGAKIHRGILVRHLTCRKPNKSRGFSIHSLIMSFDA
jgi:hypothetical protein